MSFYAINGRNIQRPDFEEVDILNIFEDMVAPEEVFLGEVLSNIDDPVEFMSRLKEVIEDHTIVSVQELDTWEIFDECLFNRDLESVNKHFLKQERFLDITETRKICEEAGFNVLSEDIDNNCHILILGNP
jgi:hypothetical protein